jgi:hypothetical protein
VSLQLLLEEVVLFHQLMLLLSQLVASDPVQGEFSGVIFVAILLISRFIGCSLGSTEFSPFHACISVS